MTTSTAKVVYIPGTFPRPEVSLAEPVTAEPAMGPEPVPDPSGVSKEAKFLRTWLSTHPEVVRLAAVDKVWVPDSSWERKMGPSVEGYAVIAGSTAAAVGTNVLARSKVALHDVRVDVFSVAEAAIIRDPVPVPLVTRIIATEMKRVPDVEAGVKFSIVVPFFGLSPRLFVFGCPPGVHFYGDQ